LVCIVLPRSTEEDAMTMTMTKPLQHALTLLAFVIAGCGVSMTEEPNDAAKSQSVEAEVESIPAEPQVSKRRVFCQVDADCDDGNPCTVDVCDRYIPSRTRCLNTVAAECIDAGSTGASSGFPG
jgi:hypothetical protein